MAPQGCQHWTAETVRLPRHIPGWTSETLDPVSRISQRLMPSVMSRRVGVPLLIYVSQIFDDSVLGCRLVEGAVSTPTTYSFPYVIPLFLPLEALLGRWFRPFIWILLSREIFGVRQSVLGGSVFSSEVFSSLAFVTLRAHCRLRVRRSATAWVPQFVSNPPA
jgi:hypothetical protein